jgi:hypothetical protein
MKALASLFFRKERTLMKSEGKKKRSWVGERKG